MAPVSGRPARAVSGQSVVRCRPVTEAVGRLLAAARETARAVDGITGGDLALGSDDTAAPPLPVGQAVGATHRERRAGGEAVARPPSATTRRRSPRGRQASWATKPGSDHRPIPRQAVVATHGERRPQGGRRRRTWWTATGASDREAGGQRVAKPGADHCRSVGGSPCACAMAAAAMCRHAQKRGPRPPCFRTGCIDRTQRPRPAWGRLRHQSRSRLRRRRRAW